MKKRKEAHIEYRLFVFPSYKEVTRKATTTFRLQTTEQFSNFSYEIVVKDKVEEKKLSWSIHGLRSPAVSLPSSGPAIFKKEYENLKGVHDFIITKLDGEENVFSLSLAENKIAILKSPKRPFVDIVTSGE